MCFYGHIRCRLQNAVQLLRRQTTCSQILLMQNEFLQFYRIGIILLREKSECYDTQVVTRILYPYMTLLRFLMYCSLEVIYSQGKEEFTDIYIVTQLFDCDLDRIIASSQVFISSTSMLSYIGNYRRAYSVFYVSNSPRSQIPPFCTSKKASYNIIMDISLIGLAS